MTRRAEERPRQKHAEVRPRGPGADRPPPRRGGRPSPLEAQRLGERILDVATTLFLAEGYGVTSIEAVARRARISKRTFYHRFTDKAALFGAVVHRIIERLRPPADVPLYEGRSLEEVLRRLAELMLRAALTPAALALNRLILSESQRFPELARAVAQEGAAADAVRRIAALLDREAQAGRLTLDNTGFAAAQFMQIVIGLPQRRALGVGEPMSEAELNAWADDAVNLFLNGCRGWKRDPA
ncbi:MAG TPA: TetR/AcrR family transcriptional regulator [Candidatus Cybelea sp.]|nr:TetR/AcrR family transcriptional regulator [Candidatus Cybelea sp.]